MSVMTPLLYRKASLCPLLLMEYPSLTGRLTAVPMLCDPPRCRGRDGECAEGGRGESRDCERYRHHDGRQIAPPRTRAAPEGGSNEWTWFSYSGKLEFGCSSPGWALVPRLVRRRRRRGQRSVCHEESRLLGGTTAQALPVHPCLAVGSAVFHDFVRAEVRDAAVGIHESAAMSCVARVTASLGPW